MKNCSLNYRLVTGCEFGDGKMTARMTGCLCLGRLVTGVTAKTTLYTCARIHNDSCLLFLYTYFNNSFLLKNDVIVVISKFDTVFNLSFLAVTTRHYFLHLSWAVLHGIKKFVSVHDGVKA